MIDKAKVKNPDDMDKIKLALQGYNFGELTLIMQLKVMASGRRKMSTPMPNLRVME